jgi:Rieske 2Fe-2S family protein
MTYAVALPSLFVVGHVDHARSMRILPLGPERTLIEATWLVPAERVGDPSLDIDRLTGLAKRVIAEDAAACELNQRGLTAAPFEAGVLMQEEYELHAFHAWLRERLGETVEDAGSRAGRRG